MKILVIGSGGREHALVWKLRQSATVEKVWCAPGNGGIAQEAECVALDLHDVKAAADLAQELGADLTIVGPELPLVNGIADEFIGRKLAILGPTKQAAQLEGSKVFAKNFLQRHSIPTAPVYGIFETPLDAFSELCAVDWPLVVKADGLCSGKGVLVTSSPDEATAFIDKVMSQRVFGDAGKQILLEEGLVGEELSYIILTDGKSLIPMVPTRDHKRAYDNDKGPNTGGMGAYSADGMLSGETKKQILDEIVWPTLKGLQQEGIPYCGFLYFGLMMTKDGPKVLEFNCRLGDPEAEAILPRADFDLAECCMATTQGRLGEFQAQWKPGASLCVVIASEGYPDNPKTGKMIQGAGDKLNATDVVVFHAGTRVDGKSYYTHGGRVLEVSAIGKDLAEARRRCYDVVSAIRIEGSFYRKDIGLAKSSEAASNSD
jgi:phosphoribosylamine---glycine ligase